ncbi:MAG: cytidylate kinase family protein [Acidobacteria bacterium]|nr:cytidylate kinase family protein [Acidobacteriota bacterium]
MAFLSISGEPGCRVEEIARLTAQRLHFDLVTEARLRELIAQEFGSEMSIPDKAWPALVMSLLAHVASESPIVVCVPGAELLFADLPSRLRCFVVASEARRIGLLMLEHRLERPAAKQLLRQLERQLRETRKKRFGRANIPASRYDLIVNTEHLDSDHVAGLLEQTATARGMLQESTLPAAAEAQIQFQMRLRLARYGISPPGKVALKRKPFANHSEEIFTNLLDFYRIAWEYEPKSFPIQWDEEGRVLEAFTPDFYLPEFDLYVELTTMKQAHVTKKNRKVKLLRTIYPHINIQVFYQKDFRNLIFKYGLAERSVPV